MDERSAPAVAADTASPAAVPRWRCAAPAELHLQGWREDGEAVVFDASSGRTHVLPMAAARLLLQLRRRGEATLPALAAPGVEGLEPLQAHLATLAGLHLIERAGSS